MTEDPKPLTVKKGRAELTLEQIAAALPIAEDSMFMIGEQWSTCVHAARGGNWRLATLCAKHVRKLINTFGMLNPHYAQGVETFKPLLEAVVSACEKRDAAAFEPAFKAATDAANAEHVGTGHGFVLWKIPPTHRGDLELGPIDLAPKG
ncbi:MAG: hypothetical protein FJ034_01000 [Chloroflexi bacterium]|nr:hypothetical protein [Chloroflexota bacterium]